MGQVTTKLFLEDYKVLVDIGIHEFEQNAPQRVAISVEILLDSDGPVGTDDINSTLDYDFIRTEIKDLIKGRRFNLQETLCWGILNRVKSGRNVRKITVKTKKLDVYSDCAAVGIEMIYSA
tara:strand:+ start:3101 stop:3463 length:363 start_codon:yes stop_codon:yes gene_type:complete